jgi:hypothetical protein
MPKRRASWKWRLKWHWSPRLADRADVANEVELISPYAREPALVLLVHELKTPGGAAISRNVRFGSKADIGEMSTMSPLYPNKRTSIDASGMSASRQKRKFVDSVGYAPRARGRHWSADRVHRSPRQPARRGSPPRDQASSRRAPDRRGMALLSERATKAVGCDFRCGPKAERLRISKCFPLCSRNRTPICD